MNKDFDNFIGRRVMITHKSGMKDFGKLTLIKDSKKWRGTKGYKYMLEDVPYKMRSIKSIKDLVEKSKGTGGKE